MIKSNPYFVQYMGTFLRKLYTKNENKRPVGLIAPPFTIGFLATENLPKVKLGQVEVGSNIAQNHSSSP